MSATRRPRDARSERRACPLYTALAVIGGRWKPMIYQRLLEQPRGFAELRRTMPHVTTKVLRQQLRQMTSDGVLAREPLVPAHLGVRYRITPYGRTLAPVFEALWRWGRGHLARPGASSGTVVAAPLSVVRLAE